MTIIDPNKPAINPLASPRQTEPSTPSEGRFTDIWKETVQSSSSQQAAAVIDAPASIATLRPAQFSTASPIPARDVADQAQRLLDTMEIYQQQLTDRKTTLHDIQPTIEKMASQSQSLSDEAAAANASGELKAIVDRSLSLVTMEISRYYNGDYT